MVVRGSDALGRFYGGLLDAALSCPRRGAGRGDHVRRRQPCSFWQVLPRQLTPAEDRASLFIALDAPEGATVEYTDGQVRQIEGALADLQKAGEVQRLFANVGFGNQSTRGFVVVTLKPWEERGRTQLEIVRTLTPRLASISGARVVAINPQGLGLRGSSQPVQVVIGGPDIESVRGWAEAMLEQAEQNPGLTNLQLDYEPNRRSSTC